MFSFLKTKQNIILQYSHDKKTHQNSPVFIHRKFGYYKFEMEQKAKRYNLKIMYTRDSYIFDLHSDIKAVEKFVDELNAILVMRKLVETK